MPPREKINLADITAIPIGDTITADGGFELPTNSTRMVQCNVPPEWSEGGTCGALRVSGVFVERGTRSILGAMGSHVYPSVSEGASAITNQLNAAVAATSNGKAMCIPLRRESDG